MECVSEGDVLGFVRGTLEGSRRSMIEAHLDRCGECLELVTLAGKTSLASTLPAPTEELSRDALTAIERYEIGEQIGRGAMGTVYVARDTRLGRRVAIKVVHPRLAGDERSQVGLLREAQALARIAQPNVLTVHDVGVVDNAVFLAAELVEGDTLEAWLAKPRRWRAIVEVFLQAARGLDAAHTAGLVHRDFKPSNVLIGHDGRVRVFDFGLARFSETIAAGEVAGTPLYMSPEQRRGEVADARSDQYAYCVALHEALSGQHPTMAERATVAASDRAPRWLRDLVRRGLARARDDRFPSMREVILRLERGLARRSRVLVAGTASFALVAAAAVAMIAYARGKDEPLAACPVSALETWDAPHKAQLAQRFAATSLPYVATTTARVTAELDKFAARWAAQHRDVCLSHADAELSARRTTCLDHQRLVFDAIVDRFMEADRKGVERAHFLLGALPDLDACARPTGAAWPADATARARFATHFRESARVQSLAEAGQYDEAAQRVLALAAEAKTLGFRQAEADAMYLQGHIEGLQGKLDAAVTHVEAALWSAEESRYDEMVVTAANELIFLISSKQRRPEVARQFVKLARSAAERMGTVSARARTARSIGNLELFAGHFEAAAQELERGVALEPGDALVTALLMMDLSNLQSQRGRPIAAEILLRYAISIYRRELGELHPRHGAMLNNLANAMMDLRRTDEAAPLYEQAIAILERSLGPDHADIGQLLANANGVYLVRNDVPRARAMIARALAILEKTGSKPILASAVYNLAQIESIEHHAAEAETLFQRALALRLESLGEHHPKVTESLLAVAGMALAREDLATTRTYCERAARSIAGSDVGDQAWQGSIETCFAELELLAGHPEKARALVEAALARHAHASEPMRRAYTQFVLARTLPARDRARARELAQGARTQFLVDGMTYQPDIEAIDRWLRDTATSH